MEGRRTCRDTNPCLLRLTWTWELLRDAVREAMCEGAESVHQWWMCVCTNCSVTLSRSRQAPVCQIWCVYASVRTLDSSCLGGKRGQVHPEEGNQGEERLVTPLETSQVQIRVSVDGAESEERQHCDDKNEAPLSFLQGAFDSTPPEDFSTSVHRNKWTWKPPAPVPWQLTSPVWLPAPSGCFQTPAMGEWTILERLLEAAVQQHSTMIGRWVASDCLSL